MSLSNRITTFVFLFVGTLFLSHCNTTPPMKISNKMRLQAVREAAETYGAQSGLAWASKQIDKTLDSHAKTLGQLFDFRPLLSKNHLLPPVISEGAHSLNMNDQRAIRFADHIYTIDQPARLVATPPSWRDYLYLNYAHVSQTDRSLLPRDEVEGQLWKEGVKQGWQHGVMQAHQLFQINLARLKHDYTGMQLYRLLRKKNMISAPYVARVRLGITGDKKKIRINDQLVRITSESNLKLDSKQWQPIVINP